MITKVIKEAVGYSLLQTHSEKKSASGGIVSIFFHDPPKNLFDRVLGWLIANGYTFISIQELDDSININIKRKKEENKKLAFVSFDDGWKNNLKLVASIEKYEVPVAIFIPTGPIVEGNYWWEYASIKNQHRYTGVKSVEGFKKLPGDLFAEKIRILKEKYNLNRSSMTKNELIKLNNHDLITLGAHTVTHPILKRCSSEQQARELIESKQTLSDWLGEEIQYLAYPDGAFDARTIDIVKKSGYKLCFATVPGRIDVEKVNPYIIPRTSIEDDQGYFESISKILGVWQEFKGILGKGEKIDIHNLE